ncbi:hypothetical protein [Gilvimarinus xylanilyticus]|uniref:Uncharacterized protein n=1 Tax=Gilvimarinus xylanilyticus TaxID=2944139 RepID=A0A9X2I7V4_9GAMM|nr:hypothetical protein [Gilvimarinus xylanilyticus]MCP8900392.1 hypothetical protein [Gilvimarinus xylanilyticus]
MKSLAVIVIGLIVSWVFTDVRSPSGFYNLFMPLCGVLFFIALMVWAAFALAAHRSGGSGNPSAYDILDSHDHTGGDGGAGGD